MVPPGEPATVLADGSTRATRLVHRWADVQVLLAALVFSGIVIGVGMRPADLTLYQHYARLALGAPLLHSLPKEYPFLSLAVFLVPQVAPFAYPVLFGLLAAAATVALVLLTDGLADWPGWSRRACTYFLLGSIAVVVARYDVFPVLVAMLAVENARRRSWGRAWAWGVLGGLLKLFPFLLLPGFLLVERAQTGKWALRRPAFAALPVAAVAALQSLLAPGSLLTPVRYELNRGFELSSVQGSLSFLAGPLHAHWVSGFGSIEVVAGAHALIGAVFSVLEVGGLLASWWFAWRGRLPVEAVSLAVVSVAVMSDKAFGAQYLIWLIPLWAYWPLKRGWLATAALTTVVYPLLYAEAQDWGPGYYLPTSVAVLRNALFVATTCAWLWQQLRTTKAPQRATAVPSTGPRHGAPEALPSLAGMG